MSDIALTLILPVRNVEREIDGILQFLSPQIVNIPSELIIVDIGSTDSTVLQAVQALHAAELRGCVVQNGDATIAAALNTGLARVHGAYVSFLFARRLYVNFLNNYYQTALRTSADVVFGCMSEDAKKRAAKRLPGTGPENVDFVRQLLKRELQIDISAMLVRARFLTENHIQFAETCRYGYAEEFVLRCMLLCNVAAQAPLLLRRDTAHELHRGKTAPCGREILQRVDAMVRILDVLHTSKCGSAELIALFQEQRIPEVIFSCIDILLREGCSYGTVNLYLRHGGYDKMLITGKNTDAALKKKIMLWKTVPWMYRPGSGKKFPWNQRH
ncbi:MULTISPECIES: glycosyltransferase family 2 protein [Caproicibacterium]|uniref:Glycosyltransferase n=1 Tax=Caproicibacterium argilliputei TaxID=3030016 RepID=A0AA97D643_9FIRM|nr:glycosyltransferase [Caproicibacterium argilliputei]WOC31084.1 glycosyltransferase [Caproicibacterium argilliputei]